MSAPDQTTLAKVLPSQEVFFARCASDPELGLAIRHWTGGLRFESESATIGFSVINGSIAADVPSPGDGVITVAGPSEHWQSLSQATPPPFAQISVLAELGKRGLQRSMTDPTLWWQYLPAVERASELLRVPGGQRVPRRLEGGPYFAPSHFGELSDPAKQVDSSKASRDPDRGRRLWDLSIEMTGVNPGI